MWHICMLGIRGLEHNWLLREHRTLLIVIQGEVLILGYILEIIEENVLPSLLPYKQMMTQ